MINKNLLRSKLAAGGLTQKQLGKLLGWSENTVSSKINGRSKLCVDEVDCICKILNITNPIEKADIFLQNSSQNRDETNKRDST